MQWCPPQDLHQTCNTALRVDINTTPLGVAHKNSFNFDIGCSPTHGNGSPPAPTTNNALKVHQCKEKTVKAAHPFCVAPPFLQPRLHALCAIHLCPHHPPKVWPWVFGKQIKKSTSLCGECYFGSCTPAMDNIVALHHAACGMPPCPSGCNPVQR